ncbi:MAG: hypothetical protein D6734_09505 [Candidatus Schekmanbacteria bacterium]|nr:MAG: hypothetical protein D6734_09505 [Candidatus Schekmanbacteria bacterium]
MNIYAGVEEELRVISLSNFGYYSNKEQMHKKDVLSFFNSVNEITNHVSCTTYQHDIFIDNGSRVNIEVPQFEPEISTPELVLNDNPLSHKLFISQILANRLIVLKAIDNLKRKGVNLDISLAAVLPWLHNSPNGMGEHLHLSSHYSIPERTLNSIFLTLICTDPSFCGVGAPSTNLSSGGFEASAKVRTHNAFSSDLCQSRKPLLSERNRYDLPADWCYFKVVNLEAAKSQRQMLLSCLKKAAVLFLIIQGADFSGFSNFLPIAPVEDVKKFSFDLFGNSIRIPFKDGNSYTWLEADEKYYNLANDYAKKNKSAPHWFKWTIKEWEYWRNIYLTKDYEKLSQISDKGIKLFLLFNPIWQKRS